MSVITQCPRCGGRIELTVKVYAHVEGEHLVIDDVPLDTKEGEARWYCENDHRIRGLAAEALTEKFKHLSAFGRPPGSGSLGIVLESTNESLSEP